VLHVHIETEGGRGGMEEALRLPLDGTLWLDSCCKREVEDGGFVGTLVGVFSFFIATTASTVKCLMFLPCGGEVEF
jgi:hypothetical protein